MKIELKNIEYSERMSQETSCFAADLYINGKCAGVASNRGHGGSTDYHAHSEEGRALINEAEAYCKTLPPYTYESYGENRSIAMDFELYIENLLLAYLQQKELQKFRKSLDRAMVKGFVFGKPDESYEAITFKVPLQTIMSPPNQPEVMVNLLKKHLIPELKDGNILLNTNIPESILKQAGLSKEQYTPCKSQEVKASQRQTRNKGKGI